MELSRITIGSPREGGEKLYYKGGKAEDNALFLCAGETSDFRTFFSSLDTQLLLEKTTVRRVTLRLFFDGRANVKLYRSVPTDDKPKKLRKNFTQYVAAEADGENEIRIETDVYGGGLLGFTVTAFTDTDFYGGLWECADTDMQRRPSLGIVICTYRREEEVKRNAAACAELAKEIAGLDVFVVDNGGTLSESDLPRNVKLLPCRNLGGSGGFTRGMMACEDAGKSHFLLMDDDIEFDPNIVRRTAAILSVLKKEYETCSIGGAMMSFSAPDVVYENGAKCGGAKLKLPKHNVPVTDTGGLLWCRADCDVNFCGWWYFCAPVSVIREKGYPMPFFIKYDDTEYGMRIGDVSPTIYTVGIGVWHKDFAKPAPYIGYYLRRNAAVTHAVAGLKGCGRRNRIRLVGSYFQLIFRNRKLLGYMLDGLDDYLKGPEFFMLEDGEELNRRLIESQNKKRGFFALSFRTLGLFFRLFSTRSVNKRYHKNIPLLASRAAWEERLQKKEEQH